jgi:hypothetical protein
MVVVVVLVLVMVVVVVVVEVAVVVAVVVVVVVFNCTGPGENGEPSRPLSPSGHAPPLVGCAASSAGRPNAAPVEGACPRPLPAESGQRL